ncbi:T9SS type A sorting domain-containing protein [Tenacibaculum sp. 190524A02b]|uniref:Secretion system C-terminal sorting domain-containing protein n=1 Tax=Tenacibaculum vairaonense TaxID=3137860 RepID=A0ABP1FC19_9FLAO
MNKQLLLFYACYFVTQFLYTQEESKPTKQILFEDSFEKGWEGWIDGGSACHRYFGDNSSDGDYSIRLRDNLGNASSTESTNYNLRSFTKVNIYFDFYTESMSKGRGFWLKYYNGKEWTICESWEIGKDFVNEMFYSVNIELNSEDYNFTENSKFKFECNGKFYSDKVYLDKIKIEATSATCYDGVKNGFETGIDCGGNCLPCQGENTELIFRDSFENGWGGWIDGGKTCSRYYGTRSSDGEYSIRLRGSRNYKHEAKFTSPYFDLTNYNKVLIEFDYYIYGMSFYIKFTKDFFLRYFDGIDWVIVKKWTVDRDFNSSPLIQGIDKSAFYKATVVMDASDYNFSDKGRFRFDFNGNQYYTDMIYLDKVRIKGFISSRKLSNFVAKSQKEITSRLLIYPNPIEGNTLFLKMCSSLKVTYKITNLIGQVIQKGKLTEQLNVSKLEAGVYLFRVNEGDEEIVQKFVKK